MIRDDYREFLELALLYSGGNNIRKITFKSPGPINRARFMQKGIYLLKMGLFAHQIQFSASRRYLIEDLSLFIVTCYIKRWMEATNIVSAPYDDFSFIKDIEK